MGEGAVAPWTATQVTPTPLAVSGAAPGAASLARVPHQPGQPAPHRPAPSGGGPLRDPATGVGWSDVAATYARTFALLCAGAVEPLLDAAGVGRDDLSPRGAASGTPATGTGTGGRGRTRLLDVGTGTGSVAAAAVVRGAQVTAVDPDAAMVAWTGRAVPEAEVARAGLPGLPYDEGAFDVVVAGFVVNHLADPRAGVAELAGLVAPGGRLAVTIWPSGQNAQSRLWAAVLADAGVVTPPSVGLPPDRDFPRTLDGLTDLVAATGLEVAVEAVRWTHRGDPASLWEGASAGIGGIGATVCAQDDATRLRLRAAYDHHVAALVRDGELAFETEALLAVGRRR